MINVDIDVLYPSTIFPLLQEMDRPFIPELLARAVQHPSYSKWELCLDGTIVFYRYLVFLDLSHWGHLTWEDGKTYKDCHNYKIKWKE